MFVCMYAYVAYVCNVCTNVRMCTKTKYVCMYVCIYVRMYVGYVCASSLLR